MAAKKNYRFLINDSVINCGKAVGQVRARTLLKETSELLSNKGWKVQVQKADKISLLDPKGSERVISIQPI